MFAINDKDAFLVSYRAARNMAFQGLSPARGEVVQLAEIDGASIVGTKVKAPSAVIPEVYVLPMESVKATKARQSHLSCLYHDTEGVYLTGNWRRHLCPL